MQLHKSISLQAPQSSFSVLPFIILDEIHPTYLIHSARQFTFVTSEMLDMNGGKQTGYQYSPNHYNGFKLECLHPVACIISGSGVSV
jgi:hypothetical protein